MLAGCHPAGSGECRIHGTMADHSRDGKKIYLVPLKRSDSIGVDSAVITDGRFEFTTRKHMMAILRVELRRRYGTEELLVVTEPGDVNVRIGSTSSAAGTPQNDSLQRWKEHTQRYTMQLQPYRKRLKDARRAGDTVAVAALRKKTDSLQQTYRQYSRRMAQGLEPGVLQDFLKERFPEGETQPGSSMQKETTKSSAIQ